MPKPRPLRSIDYGPDFKPSPYTREIIHTLLDSIDALEVELAGLIEVRCVPERYREQAPSNHESALDVLRSLEPYPERMRQFVKETCLLHEDNEDALSMYLQRYSRTVLTCSGLLKDWFDAAGQDSLPVAIQREVDAAFRRRGLGNLLTIVAVGPPDVIDIRLEDVRSSFVFPDDLMEDQHSELYTVLRMPPHGAASPYRWPIVLGHEVSHLSRSSDAAFR